MAGALILAQLGACALREEFFRGEVKHLHEAGNKAYKGGDYALAREHFERIEALAPKYMPARISLANLALARGDARSAVRRYRAVIADEPARRDALLPYLAFALTVPDTPRGAPAQSLSVLVTALDAAQAGEFGPLEAFARGVDDKPAWVDALRRVRSGREEALTRMFLELFAQPKFEACPQCLLLAGCWLVDTVSAEHWTKIEHVLALAVPSPVRRELSFRLARSYERHGARDKAVALYVSLLPDERAKARLRR